MENTISSIFLDRWQEGLYFYGVVTPSKSITPGRKDAKDG
jgi:hypothetical protein